MLLLKIKEPTPKSISPGAGVNNAAVTLEASLLEKAVYAWAESNNQRFAQSHHVQTFLPCSSVWERPGSPQPICLWLCKLECIHEWT